MMMVKGIGRGITTGDGRAVVSGLSQGATSVGTGVGQGVESVVTGTAEGVFSVGQGLFHGVKVGAVLTGLLRQDFVSLSLPTDVILMTAILYCMPFDVTAI